MADCFNCRHSRPVPGDSHLSCAHPVVGEMDQFLGSILILTLTGVAMARSIGLVINRHGFEQGWAMWPGNFDPAWIEKCDGFIKRTEKSNGQA